MKTIELTSDYKRIFVEGDYGIHEQDVGSLTVGRAELLLVGWLNRYPWPESDPSAPYPMEVIESIIRLKSVYANQTLPHNPIAMEVSVDESDSIVDINDLLNHVHHADKKTIASYDWLTEPDYRLPDSVMTAVAEVDQTDAVRNAILGDYPYEPWVIANNGAHVFNESNRISAIDCTLRVDYYDTALSIAVNSETVHVGQEIGITITRNTQPPHYPVSNGGLTVSLVQFGDGSISGLPSTVTIPINETSVLVTVTATTRGTVTIVSDSSDSSAKSIDLSVLGEATGFLNKTESGDTLTASGTLAIQGSLNVSESDDTLTASGNNHINSGRLDSTERNDTLTANGRSSINGSLNTVERDDTLTATGVNFKPHGRLNADERDDTLIAVGSLAITARLAITTQSDTLTASGKSVSRRRGVFVSGNVFRKKQRSVFLGN